jgi:hypothetical protein
MMMLVIVIKVEMEIRKGVLYLEEDTEEKALPGLPIK